MQCVLYEEVWLNRDNVTELVIVADGEPVTGLSAFESVAFCIDDTVVDSAVWGSDVVWWTDGVTGKQLVDGTYFTGQVVRARLGRVSGIDAGEYEDCRLVARTAASPSGIVISDNLTFAFYDSCG